MKLRPEQLAGHLGEALAPVYLITGDEPLLVAEARAAVVEQARAAGYDERVRLDADRHFEPALLTDEMNSLSLFATRRLFDLHLADGHLGAPLGKALAALAEQPTEDALVVVSGPRLEASAQKSAWHRKCIEHGVVVQVWPVGAAELPAWLAARARASGLGLDADAAQLLAEAVEGNLLAAVQELEKIRLRHGDGVRVDADRVQQEVSNGARYTLFDFPQRVLCGEPAAALRVLGGLREEGVEPFLIVWAMARELRTLPTDEGSARMPPARRRALTHARRNGHPTYWAQGLRRLAEIDRVIKGARPGNAWDALAAFGLGLATRLQAGRGRR